MERGEAVKRALPLQRLLIATVCKADRAFLKRIRLTVAAGAAAGKH